jgi:hypothetical protein
MKGWDLLEGVSLAVSHRSARFAVQRCHFHLQQNAGAYVRRQSLRVEVATVFEASSTHLIDQRLKSIYK